MLKARGITALVAATATILAASTISLDPAAAYLPDFESRMTETGILQTAYFFPEPGVGGQTYVGSVPSVQETAWYFQQGVTSLPVYWMANAASDPGPSPTCRPSVIVDGTDLYAGPDLTAFPQHMSFWALFTGMHPFNGTSSAMTLDSPAFAAFVSTAHRATGTITLDCGAIGTATWTGPFVVTPTPPQDRPGGVSIDDGADFTNTPKVRLYLGWDDPNASRVKVSNDGGFAPSKSQEFDLTGDPVDWTLVELANERLPRTVYVKYYSLGTWEKQTYTDDILLDTVKPQITSATVSGGTSRARAASRTLLVRARDNRSGVASVQASAGKKNPKAAIRPFATKVKVAGAGTVFARVRDGAGNWSPWRTAS